MASTTTNGQLYIVELAEPFERMEIQFVPNEVQTPVMPDIQRVNIVGRNNKRMYLTGREETLSMDLDFYSDDERRRDVIQKIEWLKSLTMNDGYEAGIRKVKIIWGDLFPYQVWTVDRVSPRMSHFDDQNGWLPMRASVNINFVLDPETNLLIKDVRRNG